MRLQTSGIDSFTRAVVLALAAFLGAVPACSAGSNASNPTDEGSGGAAIGGGAATAGGALGAGGSSIIGGATSSGGSPNGGSAGGAASSGGAANGGAAASTGGAITAGGASNDGGSSSAGGTLGASGGSSDGGAAPAGHPFVIGSENKDGPLSTFESATQCDVNIGQISTGWCNTWSNWEATGCGVINQATTFVHADPKHVVELSLAPWPQSLGGQSWGACASGSYDSHYTKLAQTLIANGVDWVIIRLGYEWDGDWFPWGTGFHATGSATAAGPGGTGLEYAACIKKFDAAVQAVAAGAGRPITFRIVMNPIHDAFRAQAVGLQQVFDAAGGGRKQGGSIDFVGVDLYDYPTRGDFDASMQAAIAFAKQNGMPLSIPEWGVGGDSRSEPAVDDNGAVYVGKMAGYMKDPDNGIYYASYFNCASQDCAGLHSIIPPNNPKSLAAFVSNFGNGKLGCGADARAMLTGL